MDKPSARSPVQLLYRARKLFGSRIAVVDGERRFTYEEFVGRCEAMAAELQRRGVGRGDVVAFESFNTHQMAEAYFAPALIGAVCLPINARLARAEIQRILDDSRPKLVWTEPFPECRGRVDGPVEVKEDETAALFYTSGTTGEPKPVRLSHRNLHLHADALTAATRRAGDAVELQAIPLFHANGWGRVHMSVLNGNCLVMLRRFDGAEALRLIEREGVTDTALVPVMARDLVAAGTGQLREVHLGGSDISLDLVARVGEAFRCRVSVGYGMTEANSAITYDGVPLPGVEVRVDEVGEIWLRGETIACDGWLATGDLGRWAEGRLQVIGRTKDIIISGGENFSVLEVERAITEHPDVAEAAVVGVPDERWGEIPIAYVVLHSGVQKPGLSPFLRGRIAAFKVPKQFIFLNEPLPRNGAGKVATGVLREKHRAAAPSRKAEAMEEHHVDGDLIRGDAFR